MATIKKAANGTAQPPKKTLKPTYKNLSMARSFSNKTFGKPENTAATSKDSSYYKLGFAKGAQGKTPAVDEDEYEKMGRWEGQNAKKNVKKNGGIMKKAKTGISVPKKNSVSKNIGNLNKAENGKSFPDLNKDGKVTKADILKGRGVIAQDGKKLKKVSSKLVPSSSQIKANVMPPKKKMGGKIKKKCDACK